MQNSQEKRKRTGDAGVIILRSKNGEHEKCVPGGDERNAATTEKQTSLKTEEEKLGARDGEEEARPGWQTQMHGKRSNKPGNRSRRYRFGEHRLE